MIGAIASPPLTRGVSMTDSTISKNFLSGPDP